MTLNEAVLLA